MPDVEVKKKKYYVGQTYKGVSPPPGKWRKITPGEPTSKTKWMRVG